MGNPDLEITNIIAPCHYVPYYHRVLSQTSEFFVYKAVIKSVWNYRTELWRCASKSNIFIMQRSQSKIIRAVGNAPHYVTNHTLHRDLNSSYVSDVIHERINKHHNKLEAHPNPIFFFPVALQPYRALADRAAAAGQRS